MSGGSSSRYDGASTYMPQQMRELYRSMEQTANSGELRDADGIGLVPDFGMAIESATPEDSGLTNSGSQFSTGGDGTGYGASAASAGQASQSPGAETGSASGGGFANNSNVSSNATGVAQVPMNAQSGATGQAGSAFGGQPMSSGNQISIPNFGFTNEGAPNYSGDETLPVNGQMSSASASTSGSPNSANSQSGSLNQASGEGQSSPSSASARSSTSSNGPVGSGEYQFSKTSVVRAIRVEVLQDSWVVLDADGMRQPANTISYDLAQSQRLQRLAELIGQRVRSWGMAVEGGSWQPLLKVSVEPGAEWRFDQLQRMLQGSGLMIQRSP